jgi:DNA-binding FadR family transcriptional regulator
VARSRRSGCDGWFREDGVSPSTSDRELLLLNLIQDSDAPVGSWALVELLAEKGIALSPATIGRMLNHLEKRGYLAKEGARGRVLTELGEAAMRRAVQFREMERYRQKLDVLLSTNMLNYFIMVLEARKVIERTTVVLAVQNITDAELQKLRRIEARRERDYRRSEINAQHDIDIHRAIAAASRNEVLKIFYDMIAIMGQQSDLFDYMRTKLEAPYYVSHREILEAMEMRDAHLAEKAMVAHVDTLLRDVKAFWKHYESRLR